MNISGTIEISICIVFQININSMFYNQKKSQTGTRATNPADNGASKGER